MKTAMRIVCGVALLLGVVLSPMDAQEPKPAAKPIIQMAILLDTSNSMDGLINQARTQLWSVVNEFSRAKRDGQSPELYIALYEYGNDGLPADGGYLRQVLPLTTDLDAVSEKLFALTTNGGQEYCGHVIQQAVNDLVWNDTPDVLKTIFIAGNEPFTQGGVDFKVSCKAAITTGITVNTIHCGSEQEGANTGWKEGALLGEGNYMAIDADHQTVAIDAPQDAEILKLNAALNETYIPFGERGRAGQLNQVAQDANAANASSSTATQRAQTKATANYSNASWDLVDAVKDGAVKLEELKAEELPEAMRKMTLEERKAFLAQQEAKRAELRKSILALSDARNKFIAEAVKEMGGDAADTLETAIVQAVRRQAEKQQYTFAE